MNIFLNPTLFYYEFLKKTPSWEKTTPKNKFAGTVRRSLKAVKPHARESKGINVYQQKHSKKER